MPRVYLVFLKLLFHQFEVIARHTFLHVDLFFETEDPLKDLFHVRLVGGELREIGRVRNRHRLRARRVRRGGEFRGGDQ